MLKSIDPAQLPVALRAAVAGEAALPRVLAARLLKEFREGRRRPVLTLPGARRVDLTDREWDVLEVLSEELPTAEIARRLFISEVTVRRHISSILAKLGVSSREEAIRLVRRSQT